MSFSLNRHCALDKSRLSTLLLSVIALVVLSACEDVANDTNTGTARGIEGTNLYVSYNDVELGDDGLYYATKSVGTSTSSSVRIANRGADYYTLQNFSISGSNADEFTTQILDDLVLEPARVLSVDIAFQPITAGEKSATFTIDFDTIKQADDEDNSLEQVYYDARDLMGDAQYADASNLFNKYLQGKPATINKQRAAIMIPVIAAAQPYESHNDLELYTNALNLRDEQQYTKAIRKLNVLTAMYPDSHLADDAKYLTGYIQLRDLKDTEEALQNMQALRDAHPDTTYYDTSLYSEALAQIELGNSKDAQDILLSLKERHTGFDLLGIQLPKDNVESRLWFKRAREALKTV